MKHKKEIFITLIILLAGMLAACGGGGSTTETADTGVKPRDTAPIGDPVEGEKQFQQLCSACHGPDAKGLPNLGKDLTTSEFAMGKTDEELVEFVKTGRPSGDPLNTTGIDMPPRGGNPALTDEQIKDIVSYVRTLEN